jgi:predicted P-loop ATPase
LSANIIYGATAEEWDAFTLLFGDAILPSVCDQNVPVSENSSLKSALKIPSLISRDNTAYGMAGWQTHKATPKDITRWSSDARLGICASTRNIQAIDCDCSTPELTARIVEYFCINIGGNPPLRVGKAGRGTLLVHVDSPEPMVKSVMQLRNDGGAVEFLGANQQTMLAGTHSSGARYYWPDGLPTSVPTISLKNFAELWDALSEALGDGSTLSTHAANERALGTALDAHDPFVQILSDAGAIRSATKTQVNITCPWVEEHTDGAQGETSSTYMLATSTHPANYRCLHSHCRGRNITHLHDHFGYSTAVDDFVGTELMEPRQLTWREDPAWARKLDKTGKSIVDTQAPSNILVALKYPELTDGLILKYDTFTTRATLWNTKLGDTGPGYIELTDTHITQIRNALARNEHVQLKFSKKEVEEQLAVYLSENGVDSAKNAMQNLPEWDGVERLKYYARDVLKAADNSYTSDVGVYIFVAATARIMYAPVSVDGVPVFFGAQGCGKTTTVAGMTLVPEHYGNLKFQDNPANLYPSLAGRSIVGLDELTGLRKSDAETVKNFITQPSDSWVPKFSNRTMTQVRRCVFVGSTNQKRFLVDPTGERRLLPVEVAVTAPEMDRELQARNLKQYYAEALAMLKDGQGIVHEIYNRINNSPIAKAAKWAATKISPSHSRLLKLLASREDVMDTVDVCEIYQVVTGQVAVKEYMLLELGQSLKVIGYECIDEDLHIYKLKHESLE